MVLTELMFVYNLLLNDHIFSCQSIFQSTEL